MHNIDQETIDKLYAMNIELHTNLTNLMNASANKESNDIINSYAKQVEITSMRIFGFSNKIKEFRCKGIKM
jgi:hypothetical protein